VTGASPPSLDGGWTVAAMPGGVLDDAPPTIAFVEGRVTGWAGVNRFAGSYALEGAALTVGPLAMTRMAGPPERMHQEARLAASLDGPLAVAEDDGAIVLSGAAGALRLAPATPGASPA
jgi:heat shock protein HslJ